MALSKLALEKIKKEMDVYSSDGLAFSHLIDETVIFEMEMRRYGVVASGCLEFLGTDPECSALWLNTERSLISERIAHLMENDESWVSRYEEAKDVDEFKVPKCAEEFLCLMQLVTERYHLLSDYTAQLKFLSLQLELLDDFRLRLLQLSRSLETVWDYKFGMILNVTSYFCFVLKEWSGAPFYVTLYEAKRNVSMNARFPPVSESTAGDVLTGLSEALKLSQHKTHEGAFGPMEELYGHLREELAETLVEVFLNEVKGSCAAYWKERWHSLNQSPSSVTSSLVPFLLLLQEKTRHLHESLGEEVLCNIFVMFMDKLNAYIKNSILSLKLSTNGAAQINYDLKQVLTPFLRSAIGPSKLAIRLIDPYVKEIDEIATVLSLKEGVSILLKEELSQNSQDEQSQTLSELGISLLSADLVSKLIGLKIL